MEYNSYCNSKLFIVVVRLIWFASSIESDVCMLVMWIFHRILYEICESFKLQRKYVVVSKKSTWNYKPALANTLNAVEEFDRQRQQITYHYEEGLHLTFLWGWHKLKKLPHISGILTISSGQQRVFVFKYVRLISWSKQFGKEHTEPKKHVQNLKPKSWMGETSWDTEVHMER